MTIITPTGVTGINSLTSSTNNSLTFYNADGTAAQINVGTGVTLNSSGINVTGVSTFSTLRATSIAGVSTAGITTVYTNSFNGGQLGGSRNMIINGSMVVNQRGFTGAAGTTIDTAYTTDRFNIAHSHDGAVSAGQTTLTSTTGGNAYADGFQSALFFNVTTADASLSAGQYQQIRQPIEGYNVQGIKKGTANAQPVTLSFWVRSNVAAGSTFIIDLYDNDNTRQASQAYTINATNTWEKKILTFPADTTGVFDNDNALSLYVIWWLAAGSTYSGGTLNTSWAAINNANRAVGQTNLLASAGNNFWLTGVQLEVGDRATEFERRSYADELRLCQRYYETGIFNFGFYQTNTSGFGQTHPFVVTKRATPTMTATASFISNVTNASLASGSSNGFYNNGTATATGVVVFNGTYFASIEL